MKRVEAKISAGLFEQLDGKRVLIYLALQTRFFDVALGRLDGYERGRRLAGKIKIHRASAAEQESVIAAGLEKVVLELVIATRRMVCVREELAGLSKSKDHQFGRDVPILPDLVESTYER